MKRKWMQWYAKTINWVMLFLVLIRWRWSLAVRFVYHFIEWILGCLKLVIKLNRSCSLFRKWLSCSRSYAYRFKRPVDLRVQCTHWELNSMTHRCMFSSYTMSDMSPLDIIWISEYLWCRNFRSTWMLKITFWQRSSRQRERERDDNFVDVKICDQMSVIFLV